MRLTDSVDERGSSADRDGLCQDRGSRDPGRNRHPRGLCAAALTAIAMLLLLSPAAALAHKHSGGRCRVSIEVAPPAITAGDPVVVFGRLLCAGGGEAGQTVRLYHHLVGLPGFTYVQRTKTDANGFYELARADGVVETNRAWFVRSHGAQSASKRIRVAAQIGLNGPAEGSQLLTGPANKVTFTGTVSPADVGARVILQRQDALTGGEWRRIDSGFVQPGGNSQPGGSFTIVHTFRFPGDANIRVLVRSQRRNIPSTSSPLAYVISQAQNPSLSIVASTDPILFGQSVTISGTLSVGSGERPVTLLARTRGQRFAPVAQAMTNAGGEYSFPAQAPGNSTFYRVISAGNPCPPPARAATTACPMLLRKPEPRVVQSAVLYEGVRDILTAQVSATTVQAGQPLTFSGGVAPDQSGHVIYLERENAAHNGFHVVQVSEVASGSTYSIVHRVYDAGTKVFRVYIPGGPENLGAASQPFTITVTPAPASALMPEAPGNTSLPGEGSERGGGERGEGALESS
jgi:hypothetical protein